MPNKKKNVKTNNYSNKIKFIIFIIAAVLIYLLHKIFITNFYYKDNIEHENNSFPYNENIKTVEIKSNSMANKTVLDDNLNIYIPKGFELITDKAKSDYVVDDCEPYIKGLKDKNTFDALILICNNSEFIDIGNMEHIGIKNTIFPRMNVLKLLEKYDIHDSIDMIKYCEKNYDYKRNILTSSNRIKMNYIARNYVTFTIPSYDTFYYLDKNLRGYSIEYNREDKYFQQAHISYKSGTFGETVYGISFHNGIENYFNHDNSFEIISSISRR